MHTSFWAVVSLAFLLIGFFPLPVAAANSCNDIDITPSDVVFQEDQEGKSISFTIANEGDDPFEIDDVVLEENSPHFELSLIDFPDEVGDDDDGKIRIEYDSVDVNSDQEDDFQIKIKGEFDDEDEEQCSFSSLTFDIDVTIEDGESVCALLSISANDVDVAENETITHHVSVRNDSDEDFTIQDFDVFDDSPHFSTQVEPDFDDADFEDVIPGNSTRTYDIEIDTSSVDDDETDTAFVEIRGEFEGGDDCSFSDISTEFEVTVEDQGTDSSVCAEIGLDTPTLFIQGNQTSTESLTISNKSAQNFFVDEFIITDKNYQVTFETLSIPDQVSFGESDLITFLATGYGHTSSFDGNAFLSMKGHFTSGSTCFVSTKKIPFHYEGVGGLSCDAYHSNLPSVIILKGTATQDIFLNNPSAHEAVFTLSVTQGNVSPSIVHLPPYTAKTQTVFLSDIQDTPTLRLTVQVPGCPSQVQESTILFSGLADAPVQFKDPPSTLTIGGAKEFAVQLTNKSAYSQEVEITVLTYPGTQKFSHSTTIPGLDEPLIYLPTALLQGKSSIIIQVESAGYVVTHTMQLESISVITVDTHVSESPNNQNGYTVDVRVNNPTSQSIEGEIVAEVPTTWVITGDSHVILAPFSTKTFTLTLTPDQVLSRTVHVPISFQGFPHSSERENIALRAATNPLTTVALIIGTSGWWAGLLVILIGIGVWFVIKPKKTTPDPVYMVHSNSHSPQNGSVSDDPSDEEPWMHPQGKGN